MTIKSGEEEETDFNLCVGVGNLASNIAGLFQAGSFIEHKQNNGSK